MRANDNVTAPRRITGGLGLAVLAVVCFSLSLPATRVAVGGMDPFFVGLGRAAVAGLLALGYLLLTRAPWPGRRLVRRLLVVAVGVGVGFPLLTSVALVSESSAHGAVVIACLPLATATFAVLRAKERPHAEFWLASALGMATVLVFVAVSGGLDGAFSWADVFLLGAVVLGGWGYAEGGVLAGEIGGARTISWAVVLALPLTLPVAVLTADGIGEVTWSQGIAFGYLAICTMYLGFFAWYAAMARDGVARMGQVQLMQPVLTLGWSAVLLGEEVTLLAVCVALAVLATVVWTQRARVSRGPRHAADEPAGERAAVRAGRE
ncbi:MULTISPECIES: DMT family transporter [Thermocrispum]|jgi:drug/metabolite transporter (DMT)-like permease|uniref:DMT family transporter n=1 Tax=Thermocrispum agreste TaxID=37925 RepID=A0A2W4L6Y5_9PSEU|nr:MULTISPECIES: DMT family transporter [Thermocrispum]PZM96729.1 MAG: EamA/RhaT family transporter [Thermocrispum agreste]